MVRKSLRILQGVGIAAVALVAALVVLSSLPLLGHRSFVVKSGSMEPKIMTGGMIFDRTSANYKVGDIITFRMTGSRDTVTHRIVKVMDDNGSILYRVKGDANPAPDPNPVPKSTVVGKVSFSVPYIGYLVSYIKSLPGLILLVIMPATIIIYRELGKIKREIAGIWSTKRQALPATRALQPELATATMAVQRATASPKSPAGGRKSADKPARVVMGILVAASLAFLFTAAPSRAAYADTADLGGITITTGTWSDT